MSIRRRGMARLARRNAERRLAVFGCIRLLSLAVKRVLAQMRIVFLFLESALGARTFLVPRGHVTRNRRAERLPLGGLEGGNFPRPFLSPSIPERAPLRIPPLRLRR